MPPAKKQKAAPSAPPSALSPKEDYFARLEAVLKREKCAGSMLVVGLRRDDEDEDSEDEEDEEQELTAAQVATLRHIAITPARDKAITAGHAFASCGQSEDDCGFAMFNTSHGNEVIFGIPREVKKALKKGTAAMQFDALLGLTHGLKSFDSWMHDNECWEKGGELEKAIKALAKAWRDTLKKSNSELGIDAEFTRPGIESLLEQFQDELEECEASAEFPFKWRA